MQENEQAQAASVHPIVIHQRVYDFQDLVFVRKIESSADVILRTWQHHGGGRFINAMDEVIKKGAMIYPPTSRRPLCGEVEFEFLEPTGDVSLVIFVSSDG